MTQKLYPLQQFLPQSSFPQSVIHEYPNDLRRSFQDPGPIPEKINGHAMQTFMKTNMSFTVALSSRIQQVHTMTVRLYK